MSGTLVSTAAKISPGPITYEDYLTFPDDNGIRKEIIEGELFMSPAPSIKHQLISRELVFAMKDNNFQLVCRASKDQKIESQLLKGLQIDLDLIFKSL